MLPVALEYPPGDWNGFRVYRPARGGRSCEHLGGYKTINRNLYHFFKPWQQLNLHWKHEISQSHNLNNFWFNMDKNTQIINLNNFRLRTKTPTSSTSTTSGYGQKHNLNHFWRGTKAQPPPLLVMDINTYLINLHHFWLWAKTQPPPLLAMGKNTYDDNFGLRTTSTTSRDGRKDYLNNFWLRSKRQPQFLLVMGKKTTSTTSGFGQKHNLHHFWLRAKTPTSSTSTTSGMASTSFTSTSSLNWTFFSDFSGSAVKSAVTKLAGNNPSPRWEQPFHQFWSLKYRESRG